MAKTSLVAYVIFANLAGATRTSQETKKQLTQFQGTKDETILEGVVETPSHLSSLGFRPTLGFATIHSSPPVPPILAIPPIHPITKGYSGDGIGQSIHKELSLHSRLAKNTSTFIVNKEDDTVDEAKVPRAADINLEATVKSSLSEPNDRNKSDEVASQNGALTEQNSIASSSDRINIDVALISALEAHKVYKWLQKAVGENAHRVPTITQPDGRTEDQHLDERASVIEALKSASEALETMKKDPAICEACVAILERMRRHLQAAHARAHNKLIVTMNPKRAVLVAAAYDKAIIDLNERCGDMQRVLDQVQELEDKLSILQTEKTVLAWQTLKHAFPAYEAVMQPKRNSSGSREQKQKVRRISLKKQNAKKQLGIHATSPKTRLARTGEEATAALRNVLSTYESLDRVVIDNYLKEALEAFVAYESLVLAPRDGLGRDLTAERPGAQTEGQLASEGDSFQDVFKLASEAYESLIRDPAIYEESITVLEKVRQYMDLALSNDKSSFSNNITVIISQKIPDLHRVLGKLQELDDTSFELNIERGDLAFRALKHAYEAYEVLQVASLKSNWPATEERDDNESVSRNNTLTAHPWIASVSFAGSTRLVQTADRVTMAVKHAFDAYVCLQAATLNSTRSGREGQHDDATVSGKIALTARPWIASIALAGYTRLADLVDRVLMTITGAFEAYEVDSLTHL